MPNEEWEIWKYTVPVINEFPLDIPSVCSTLTVQVQQGVPVMWAMVRPNAPKVQRLFAWIGTGSPVEWKVDCLHYIGTIQLGDGHLAYHLFEVK